MALNVIIAKEIERTKLRPYPTRRVLKTTQLLSFRQCWQVTRSTTFLAEYKQI